MTKIKVRKIGRTNDLLLEIPSSKRGAYPKLFLVIGDTYIDCYFADNAREFINENYLRYDDNYNDMVSSKKMEKNNFPLIDKKEITILSKHINVWSATDNYHSYHYKAESNNDWILDKRLSYSDYQIFLALYETA